METKKTHAPLLGGLEIVFPLSDVIVPPIFIKLIKAQFKLQSIEEEDLECATIIVKALDETPSNIDSYVARQKLCNFLRWANEKVEMEDFTDQVMVESVGESSPELFRIRLNSETCAHSDIHSSMPIFLDPANNQTWNRLVGRVICYDQVNHTVDFVVVGKKTHVVPESLYRVRFTPSPFVFRSYDRTLSWIVSLELNDVLFPVLDKRMISKHDYAVQEELSLFTTQYPVSINFNQMQRASIFSITSGIHGRTPFILHGPPGTGKTVTLVEAIRQLVVNKSKNSRILVCTPSNTAADLFASLLLSTGDIPESKILRMYSLMRCVEEQDQSLRSVMCIRENDLGVNAFGIYGKEELLKREVIVCTLSASTYLVSGGLNAEFTHILIDEAGQSGEIETLIPLVGLANLTSGASTNIVLAGDPKQLRPVEKCDHINRKHLTISLMERYMNMNYFDKDDRRITCMLELNYRSNAAIVKIPSRLFYNDRLRSAPEVASSKDSLARLEFLPKKGLPILFHNVVQEELCEVTGHSFCNEAEISIVLLYIERIFSTTDVKPSQIGIISPYKYQVRLLQERLARYEGMTIDSVERFQGSERRVIIVSTVRSKALGFLDCDKRFNTTIMRAEELLIVVGNEENLRKQPSWNSFLEYCAENDAIVYGESGDSGIGVACNDDDNSYVSDSEASSKECQ